MRTIDISFYSLGLGFSLLIVPLFFLHRLKTGLTKDVIISALRMAIQLFLVGFYLKYIFAWNSWIINCAWTLVMICVTSSTILKKSKLNFKQLFLPLTFSLLISIVIVDAYFLGIIIKLPYVFESQYFIPITGMLLGNMLSTNVIAITTFSNSLNREQQYHRYLIGNGATEWEAVLPFVRKAIISAFSPSIASMSVMGLISLPGIMTGQILGGSPPNVAIKYQIMVMITIFSSTLISVLISIRFIHNASKSIKIKNENG